MQHYHYQHLGLEKSWVCQIARFPDCQSYDANALNLPETYLKPISNLPETVQRELEFSKKVPQSQSWAGVRRRSVENKIVDSMFLRSESRLPNIRETVSINGFDIIPSILMGWSINGLQKL